jgi:hypothetical protein
VKSVRDIILAAIVSFEFLLVCIAFVLSALTPDLLAKAGSSLNAHKEAFQWLTLACVGALVLSLKWARDILLPKHEHAEVLADWPHFYMVKNRTLVGLCYLFAAACVELLIWIFGMDIREPSLSAMYYAAVAVVMCSAFTLWYASVQIGIHLRRLHAMPTHSKL